MIEELIHREKMNFGVINILLQFVMLKEDMKLPKSYIFEIASNWKKKGITTAKQAYEYALKVNQPKPSNENKSQSYQGYNRKSKLVSREKTPKWLEERDNPNATALSKDEKDDQFEKDRQAFLEQLNKDWEEDQMESFKNIVGSNKDFEKRIAKIRQQVVNDPDVKQFLNEHQSELTNAMIDEDLSLIHI